MIEKEFCFILPDGRGVVVHYTPGAAMARVRVGDGRRYPRLYLKVYRTAKRIYVIVYGHRCRLTD